MHDGLCTAVCLVELFCHATDEHDREFQSLALVDTHDPHGVVRLRPDVCLAVVHLILFQIFDITDKVVQAAVARRLICDRLLHEHIEVGLSLAARRKCLRIRTVACLIQNLPQKQMHRRVLCPCAEAFQHVKEMRQLFFDRLIRSAFQIRSAALIKGALFRFTADPRKLLLIQTADRTVQHRCERNILPRVVEHLQVRKHRAHLRRGKVAALRTGKVRDSHFRQYRSEGIRPPADRAQQNHNIFILHRTVAAALHPFCPALRRQILVPDLLLSDHRLNPCANHAGFRFTAAGSVGFGKPEFRGVCTLPG